MSRTRRSLAVIICLVVAIPPLAAEPSRPARTVDRLIAQLGDERFAQREKATRALRVLDEQALEPLRRAVSGHADAEVRRRARLLVGEMEANARDAEAFATTMMEVLEALRGEWACASSQEELLGWAVRSVCEVRGGEVPGELLGRLEKAKDMKGEEIQALLRDAYARVWRQPRTRVFLLDETVQRMLQRLDPHADWGLADHDCCLRLQSLGIGLRLETDPITGMIRVLTPLRNSPAHRAGLRAGDIVTQVIRAEDMAGQPLAQPEVVNTRGLSVAEVNDKLHGPAETRVWLTVQRDGIGRPLTFAVERAPVIQETVVGWRLGRDDEWDYWLDKMNKIAYVRITEFDGHTPHDLKIVLDRLGRQGVKGLILDLRFNAGGLFPSSIDVAGQFFRTRLVLTIRVREGREHRYNSRWAKSLTCPLVCLINADTASSAEVLAASLQDHKRAVLLGERTRGKGSFQNIYPIQHHELILTTAVFYRPSGKKLDRVCVPGHDRDEWGVRPDAGHVVALSARGRERLKTYLESRAILYRRDRPLADPLADFTDRQRDRALAHLRSLRQ